MLCAVEPIVAICNSNKKGDTPLRVGRPSVPLSLSFSQDGARRAQTTARRAKKAQPRRHVVPQEHKCVLDSCRKLETEGFDVTYLPVSSAKLLLSLAKHG